MNHSHTMVGDLMSQIDNFKSADYTPSVIEPIVGTIAYGLIVYGLKKYESGLTEKLDVRNVAIVHNIILIVLSVCMAVGGISSLADRYVSEGFMGVFCSGSVRAVGTILDGSAGFWVKVFYLSKYYELGDTFLLCIKGNRTIPLHIYHHIVMMWVTWSWSAFDVFEGTIWCVIVNSIIHTAMYTYYLLAVFGKKVWWKKYLTAAQIVQFLTGFVYINIYLYNAHTRADGCGGNARLITVWSMHLVNISFVVLFSQFFQSSYKPKTAEDKKIN